MKIALLSDIHGNHVALELVLDALRADRVDTLVCLGDVALDGPGPAVAIRHLRDLGCPVVRGNIDDWALDPGEPEAGDEDAARMGDIQHWCRSCLSTADLDDIRGYQPHVVLPLEAGVEMLCVHGSPRANTEDLSVTCSDADLAERLVDFRPAIVASGHTHAAMFRRFEETLLINPGSVGSPSVRRPGGERPGWAEYAVITWESGRVNIDFRRCDVDFDLLTREVLDSGMPHAAWWLGRWEVGT